MVEKAVKDEELVRKGGWKEGRTPAAAKDNPALDIERLAQLFNVADQVPCGVVLVVLGNAARVTK